MSEDGLFRHGSCITGRGPLCSDAIFPSHGRHIVEATARRGSFSERTPATFVVSIPLASASTATHQIYSGGVGGKRRCEDRSTHRSPSRVECRAGFQTKGVDSTLAPETTNIKLVVRADLCFR